MNASIGFADTVLPGGNSGRTTGFDTQSGSAPSSSPAEAENGSRATRQAIPLRIDRTFGGSRVSDVEFSSNGMITDLGAP
jgi:hypothetical protein